MPESQRSNASSSLIVGLAAAVILALGVGVLVYNRQPQAPLPAPAPSAGGDTARPAVVPLPASVEPSAAAPKPPAGPTTRETAAAAPTGRGPSAVRPPDRPSTGTQRDTPAAPAPPPLAAQAMLRRGFVASRTASENVKGVSNTLSGFDSRKAKEVKVKRAPEIDGRIEFNTTPNRVRPGDKYSLRVSLINEGKRPIEIKEVEVTTALNRKESSASIKPLVKQVSPRQNEVIHEISGTWDKNTTSFTVEVRVMSDRLDLYRNELVWSGAPVAPAAGPAAAPRATTVPSVPARQPSAIAPAGGAAGGSAPPLTAQAMLQRGFVPRRTASENVRGVSKTLSGFDSRKSKELKVTRAPEIDGHIEFSATPLRVKPGDKYSLRVSLINEGKRPIEIKEVVVTTALNRKESSTTVKPLVKQVSPRQNEVIHEISGTWDKNTTSFTVEVRVMSDRLDLYRNELVWK